MFEKIKAAWRRWLHRRLWPVEWQLERLRSQVQEDRRWMAHDPKVAAVCDRYLEMLRSDWENAAVEPVSWFRSRIGCDPHWGRTKAPMNNANAPQRSAV